MRQTLSRVKDPKPCRVSGSVQLHAPTDRGSRCSPQPLSVHVGRQRLRERPEMPTKPVHQARRIDPASGEIKHETLLVIDGSGDLGAVKDEKDLHRGVRDALVAVDERVIPNQRETQCRGVVSRIMWKKGMAYLLGDLEPRRTLPWPRRIERTYARPTAGGLRSRGPPKR